MGLLGLFGRLNYYTDIPHWRRGRQRQRVFTGWVRHLGVFLFPLRLVSLMNRRVVVYSSTFSSFSFLAASLFSSVIIIIIIIMVGHYSFCKSLGRAAAGFGAAAYKKDRQIPPPHR
ncbi:uncharacterized protein BKA78DRAFT_192287 [Phyllosticta capitalensis]|uniref:uncharacterized protein n=1 Tax=Phyllosticta capitalensis TaxID=121624 RepID=UPI00312F320F